MRVQLILHEAHHLADRRPCRRIGHAAACSKFVLRGLILGRAGRGITLGGRADASCGRGRAGPAATTLGVVAGIAAPFAIGLVGVLLVSAIESFVESSQ